MDNIELDKLNLYLKDVHSYIVFNKYLQKREDNNFLEFRFLSNFNTYNTLSMNSTYFFNIRSNNYNEDDILIKTDDKKITKICGKEDNYIVEYNNDKLAFSTITKPKKNNKEVDDNIKFFDTRRISFISLPKSFKPSKIYDYYFDKFNNKYILILLIDDGVILSLDFSKSIKNKNNSAIFYMDSISNKKIIMLTINFIFLFFYFLDWTHLDQISINIREAIINFINNTDNQIINENNININRFDNNELSLSSSNLSLLSNISNDAEDNINNYNDNNYINMNNNNQNNNRRIRRDNNNDQRSIIEDLLGMIPY